MRSLAYTRFELVRTLRNPRLMVFTLGFPLIVFLVIAAPSRDEQSLAGSGISVPLYYMVSLVSFATMTALMLIGLAPFAALGVLLGHLLTADAIGPAAGGVVSLLALASGNWYPLGEQSFVHDVAEFLPSYWLVQASHVSLGGQGWEATGWIVVAAWTAVLVILARAAFRRDTERV